jgi:hypothetical protein
MFHESNAKTKEEFFYYYVKNFYSEFYKTYNIIDVAKILYDRISNQSITLEDCVDILICHAVIETWDGGLIEQMICNKIKNTNHDFTIINNHGYVDKYDKIDITVNDNQRKITHYLQIKPCTFIKGNAEKNPALIDDRKRLFNVHKNGYRNGFLTMLLYDKDSLDRLHSQGKTNSIINIESELLFWGFNNKQKFKVNELLDENGQPLINYKLFEKRPLGYYKQILTSG